MTRTHIRHGLALAAVLAQLLAGRPAQAGEFPLNGGFELGSDVAGWQLTGPWQAKTHAARRGKVGLWLARAEAPSGSRLVTSGYLLVGPRDRLRFRMSYACPQGEVQVGLQPCDGLGRVLGEPVWEELSATRLWEYADLELSLPAEATSPRLAAVRLVIAPGVGCGDLRLDDISLQPPTTAAPARIPTLPKVDALKVSNLLPLPGAKPVATVQNAWAPLGLPEFDRAGAQAGGAATTLTGGPADVGFESPRVALDATMPYRLTARLRGTDWRQGRVLALLRAFDPADSRNVWAQTEEWVPAGGAADLRLSLPRLAVGKGVAWVQTAMMLEAGSAGSLGVSGVTLLPEPVALSVRLGAQTKPGPEGVSLFVSAINNTAAVIKPTAVLTTVDCTGRMVHTEKRSVVMGGRSAAYFPYKPKLPAAGDFTLTARLVLSNKNLGSISFPFHVKQAEALSGLEAVEKRRVSRGFLLVSPTDRLRLSLLYRGVKGGQGAGLVLCDVLGRPLHRELPVELPGCSPWTPVSAEFDLAAVTPPSGTVGAVRLATREPDPATGEDLDAVVVTNLTTPPQPAPAQACPKVDLLRQADLLPAPRGDAGERRVGAWSAWEAPGLGPEQARATRDGDSGRYFCILTGGEKATGWVSDRIALDGALPYVFTATVDTGNLKLGHGLVVARIVDPHDTATVLWQTEAHVGPAAKLLELSLSIPRQYAKPGLTLVQLAMVLDAGAEGCLSLTEPALRPEPLTVSVRKGAAAAGAANPLAPQVYVSAVNNGQTNLKPTALVTVADASGMTVHQERRNIVIGARSAAHFPFVLRLPRAGLYQVSVSVTAGAKELGRGAMAMTVAVE